MKVPSPKTARSLPTSARACDPVTGKPYKLRTVTTIVDPGHFTLEWFRIEDGGKENRVVSMTHTRRKS